MQTAYSRLSFCFLLISTAVGGGIPAGQRQLPPEDRSIAGTFEDAFVAGRESGADHELLFGLVDVAFAADGELYILEERNHRVLVYGPEGDFRRSFGREGQGPGEFQLPMTLALTAADEVAVWDFQKRGYALFSRAGEYLRNVRWEDWLTGPRRDSLRPWPPGGVVYLTQGLQEDFHPPQDIDRGAIMHEPLGATGAPTELYVVHHPRRRGHDVAGTLVLDNGPEFAPFTRWGVLADGRLAVADGTEYRVRLVRPDSAETIVITRPLAPRPTAAQDIERARALKRASYENAAGVSFTGAGGSSGGGGSRAAWIEQVVDSMEFAEVIPVIRDLRVDFAGRMWIQRHGATYFDDGPIDVVSAAGGYIGTLPAMPMPDAFGPDGLVAWMEKGRDVEIERVVVRRLPPALR